MDLGGSMAYWVEEGDDEFFQMFRRQPSQAPGMWTRAEIVERYCTRMGYDVSPDQWRFYEVFGLYRLAVIAQQIWYRYFHGQTTNEQYAAMRIRVMRQVHFSTADQRSIDLVFFVNGLPVVTIEMKSDYTQSVEDAIVQYKLDRQPGRGRLTEPLLVAGARALVHFAVSHDEIFMTTRLDGLDTIFLPFNRGHEGGPGNPPNPLGHATSYLWEQVRGRNDTEEDAGLSDGGYR
jgi:hypothetical protein